MDIYRRDFMKLVGVTIASLGLTNCRGLTTTCYVPLPPSPDPTQPVTAHERLQSCWLRFRELAEKTLLEAEAGESDNTFSEQLMTEHRLSLDDLVEDGDLTLEVAALVQEAYDAAVYHVWRSNTMMTCYEPMIVDYAPVSAETLVHQTTILNEFASERIIDAETLENARAALEHNFAYYELTNEEISDLYDRLLAAWQEQQEMIPGFDDLDLEISETAKSATQFIIDLLIGK